VWVGYELTNQVSQTLEGMEQYQYGTVFPHSTAHQQPFLLSLSLSTYILPTYLASPVGWFVSLVWGSLGFCFVVFFPFGI
jgi:hypothetical protein